MLNSETLCDWVLAIQTSVPSDEIPVGSPPTPNELMRLPVAGSITSTASLGPSATQTSLPSALIPVGCPSSPMVWTRAPLAVSSVTEAESPLATQTSVPSAATASGPLPTGMFCTKDPSRFNSVTELYRLLTTHRCDQSFAIASGPSTRLLTGVSAAPLGVVRLNPAIERSPETTSDATTIKRACRANDAPWRGLRGDLMMKSYF